MLRKCAISHTTTQPLPSTVTMPAVVEAPEPPAEAGARHPGSHEGPDGRVPLEIPPITTFAFKDWYVASRWDRRLSSAGRPCGHEDCFWQAELGVIGPNRQAVADHSMESLIRAARAALPTNAYYIRKGSLRGLPVRDFRNSDMSAEDADQAIDELAHGNGTEPWWQLAKQDRTCGGIVIPLADGESCALFMFDRFLPRLRLQDRAEIVALSL